MGASQFDRALAAAIQSALASALGTALQGEASAAPAQAAAASNQGWTATIAVGGGAHGTIALWFERDSLAACVNAAREAGTVDDAALAEVVRAVAVEVARLIGADSSWPDVTFSAGTVDPAAAHADAGTAVDVAIAGRGTCRVQFEPTVQVTPAAAAAPTSERLQAVLDVDLPLVVRFGGVVMPLKSVAGLTAGSLIDMNRSPDEPVELLVGERVIARGEVVAIAGNYGVRITELTSRLMAGAEA